MKKARQFILISLIVGTVWTTISHTALAEKDVKLVANADDFIRKLASHISRDSMIIGLPVLLPKRDSAKIYIRNGKNWEEQAHIFPRNAGDDGNGFGSTVSISEKTAAIGAPTANGGQDNPANKGGQDNSFGSIYIFLRSGNEWIQRAKFEGDDTDIGDRFGSSVSIDRNTIVVGAPRDDDAGVSSGSAYIFVRDGDRWKQQAKLVPKDLGRSDTFGSAVFVRGDTVVVGATGHTPIGGARFAGAAYVFVREGEHWVQQAKLIAADAGKTDRFGSSVAIGGDTIVVGSPLHDTDAGTDAGAAYIFVPDGVIWKQQAKLVSKEARAKDHHFGNSVATSGNIAIVGAPGDDDAARASGAVYSFVRADGVWEERQKVVADNGAQDLKFGFSVAMSGDTVVISSYNRSLVRDIWPNVAGAGAYVYNSVEDFGTPPFAVEPFESRRTTLGQVKRTALYQNFPNPFNPETWIPYDLKDDASVTITIYDLNGHPVRALKLGRQEPGLYHSKAKAAYWDGKNAAGEAVSSGLYFYNLRVGGENYLRKALLLK